VTRDGVLIGNWIFWTLTTSSYSAIANSHIKFTAAWSTPSQSGEYSPFVAWQRLPTLKLPRLSCSRPYWVATVTQLIHCSNWLTLRLTNISHHPPTLLTTASRLPCNRSCFSLCYLGTDRIENASINISSIVTSRSYHVDCVENTAFKLFRCSVLQICCDYYLATAVVFKTIIKQRLLYNCLFRGRCLSMGLHATILYTACAVLNKYFAHSILPRTKGEKLQTQSLRVADAQV
jgi:hypothetical protein